jgi:hypothetical protein
MLLTANAWAEHWAARCLQAQPEPESLLARIDTLLDGIDRDECHPDGGWWQTSDGSKFGRIKLRELKELVSAAHLAQPQPVAPPMPVPGDAEGLAEVFWGRYDQPEPVAPTDEDLMDMAEFYIEDNDLLGLHNAGEFARAVLARWSTPANNTNQEN